MTMRSWQVHTRSGCGARDIHPCVGDAGRSGRCVPELSHLSPALLAVRRDVELEARDPAPYLYAILGERTRDGADIAAMLDERGDQLVAPRAIGGGQRRRRGRGGVHRLE